MLEPHPPPHTNVEAKGVGETLRQRHGRSPTSAINNFTGGAKQGWWVAAVRSGKEEIFGDIKWSPLGGGSQQKIGVRNVRGGPGPLVRRDKRTGPHDRFGGVWLLCGGTKKAILFKKCDGQVCGSIRNHTRQG